jgi:hypothetical protein
VAFGLFNLFLVSRAVFGAMANLTVNEAENWKRYNYLLTDPDLALDKNGELETSSERTFFNPFDKGAPANCVEFFHSPDGNPDWDQVPYGSSGSLGLGVRV